MVNVPAFVPKLPLIGLLIVFGTSPFFGLFRSSLRPAAIAAAVFLCAATLSAVLADNRTVSFLGRYGWGTGLIFIAALVGAWALGTAEPENSAALRVALFVGIGANVAVAVLQAFFDLPVDSLGLLDGRSSGLLGNPVHLAGLSALGIALLAARPPASNGLAGAAGLLCGGALQASGSRWALLVTLGVFVWACWRARSARLALVAGATAIGFTIIAFAPVLQVDGVSRLDDGVTSGGDAARLETWALARHAIGDRPLLGIGPGRFHDARTQYRTPRLVANLADNRTFDDAHNIVIEYGVTTGLIGLGALLMWLGLAGRNARGPYAVGAIVLLAMHLAQPQSLATTPLLFLLLGASTLTTVTPHPSHRTGTVFRSSVAVLALLTGVPLVIGDAALKRSLLEIDLPAAERAERLLPDWSETAVNRSWIHANAWAERRDPDGLVKAAEVAQEAVRRDPHRAKPRVWLGDLLVRLERRDEAELEYLSALDTDPQNSEAMVGLARLAFDRGDNAEALRRALAALELGASTFAEQIVASVEDL